jgi:Na+-transporting NADH:ubiquinone oxidoreductase subunit C
MSDAAPSVDFFKERIFPVLFMFIVTVVFIALVSGIYLATRENVLRNEQLYLKSAVLFAAGLVVPDDPVEADALYNGAIRENLDNDGSLRYYTVSSGGAAAGYVFPAFGPGLWGEIEAVVGFDASLNRLTGVDFTKQNETPGLGARISEEWFRLQFKGKTGPFSRVPEGTMSESDLEFDAITGATITSTAVEQILNRTIETAPGILGRE